MTSLALTSFHHFSPLRSSGISESPFTCMLASTLVFLSQTEQHVLILPSLPPLPPSPPSLPPSLPPLPPSLLSPNPQSHRLAPGADLGCGSSVLCHAHAGQHSQGVPGLSGSALRQVLLQLHHAHIPRPPRGSCQGRIGGKLRDTDIKGQYSTKRLPLDLVCVYTYTWCTRTCN